MTSFIDRRVGIDAIGFGASGLGNLSERMPEQQADATLEQAFSLGIRYFDTSPLYGHGLSELRLGRLLRSLPRSSFQLSTKVGRYMVPPRGEAVQNGIWAAPLPMKPVLDYSYDGIMRSVEQSIVRLGVEYIDIVYIHDVDRRSLGDAFDRTFDQAATESCRALKELRDAGHIGAFGIGINEADVASDFLHAVDLDCVMLAGRYTLLDQTAEETFLPLAKEKKVDVIIAGVFNSGILAKSKPTSGKFDYAQASDAIVERARGIADICQSFNVPLPAAAVQFPFNHPSVSRVVLGMSRPDRIQQNIDWATTIIPDGLWNELKQSGFLKNNA